MQIHHVGCQSEIDISGRDVQLSREDIQNGIECHRAKWTDKAGDGHGEHDENLRSPTEDGVRRPRNGAGELWLAAILFDFLVDFGGSLDTRRFRCLPSDRR